MEEKKESGIWIQTEIPFEEYKDRQLKLPFRDETLEELFKEFDKKPPFSSFNDGKLDADKEQHQR